MRLPNLQVLHLSGDELQLPICALDVRGTVGVHGIVLGRGLNRQMEVGEIAGGRDLDD